MPISKFTQPIQASPLASRPRVNLQLVSDTLDRLSASQAQGEEARSTFELLRQNLRQNVIPGEEGLADQFLDEAELGIDLMSEEANLINAAPRLAARGTALTGQFAQLAENKAELDDAIERSRKSLAAGTQTRANRFFSVEEPLQSHVPGERLVLGQQREKIDIPEVLRKQLSSFKNDKNETIEFINGRYINTVTNEGVPNEQVEAAGRLAIENDPGIRTQLIEDVRFDLRNQNPAFIDAQVQAQVDDFDIKREQVRNSGASFDSQQESLAALDLAQNNLVEDPERFIVQEEVENRIDRLIAPNVLREGSQQRSEKLVADQFAQIDLRASLSGSGSGGYKPINLTSGQTQSNLIDPKQGIANSVGVDKAALDLVNTQLQNTSGLEKQQLLREKDEIEASLRSKEAKRNQILRQHGMDPSAYEELLADKESIPNEFSLTQAQAAYLDSRRVFGRDRAFQGPVDLRNVDPNIFPNGVDEVAARGYVRAIDEWEADAGKLAKDMDNVVDRELKRNPLTTAVRTQGIVGQAQTDLLDQLNSLKNVGGIFTDTVTGNVITDPAENIKKITNVGPMNMFPINGKYSVSVFDEDGKEFSHEFSETGVIGEWLEDNFEASTIVNPITGQKEGIFRIPFAAEVLGAGDGVSIPIIRNGVDILPPGTMLMQRNGIYRLVDEETGKDMPDTIQVTDPSEMIGIIQELAREAAQQ